MILKDSKDRLLRLKSLVLSLPLTPGIYQFFDKSGVVIYIGKAKNLRRRVASYFNREPDNGKTRVLVSRIFDIQFLVVETEQDALLLENNLIKKYQPRYNILLKDDKTFPWIVVKKEPFPRVMTTRQVVKDGSVYYGPYTSSKMVSTLVDMFRKLYPLRTCKLDLSPDKIGEGRFKVCLEYHIGNCKGPCEGLQPEVEYLAYVEHIHSILKGQLSGLISQLKSEMKSLAEAMKFEEAHLCKQRIQVLTNYQSKSTIVSAVIENLDVFNLITDHSWVAVNGMRIRNGAIIQSYTMEYEKKLNEPESEILAMAMTEFYQKFSFNSREVLVPFLPEPELRDLSCTIPKIGDKKKLLDFSERTLRFLKKERLNRREDSKRSSPTERLLQKLQSDLRLPHLPVHIECFDNSNFHGTYPVAACVVFRNGKPAKRDYRHFNIKTVEGPDDYASMEEVVERRYSRLLEEGLSLPQLIVIDGGKGQLGSAVTALRRLGLENRISIIGIAKRLEEIFYPGDSVPLYLDKSSSSLKLIQFLRNEAHRFGITFHRNKRSQGALLSELDSIKGIGEVTKNSLLQKFKTVEAIKKLSEKELIDCVGKSKAKILMSAFNKASNNLKEEG